MAESNPAESSGQIGSEGDWLKRLGKVGVVSNFRRYFPIFFPTKLLYLLMSPSSVRNDGIKGVDTDALSHLGLNVGKPVRR